MAPARAGTAANGGRVPCVTVKAMRGATRRSRPRDGREQRVTEQAAVVRRLFPDATAWQVTVLSQFAASHFAVWRALAEHGPTDMCRACLQDAVGAAARLGNNGSGLLRSLRQRGLAITWGKRGPGCTQHEGTTTWQKLSPALPDKTRFTSRALYTLTEWDQLRRVIGNRDAFTGSGAVGLEIDHRVPMTRISGAEQKVDVDDPNAISDRYMGLTREHNTTKREKCRSCVETGQRPAFLGIPYWFAGDAAWDENIGCNGCGWAYPEQWKSSIAHAAETSTPAGAGCNRRRRGHCHNHERSTAPLETASRPR